ncbi:MAG: SurA N-terminal domain-containing protein [Xanthomonadales bacterium]|nr:SurA N-terminal domain-containing protein [Xanthomonadales bacterium]
MVLQSIREKLSGIVLIFIVGILIIPFAFVGVGSYFSSDAVNAVAVVNGEEISSTEYNQSFQNYRRQMQSLLGTRFDAVQFDQPIVRRQHLDSLIDERLLAQVSLEAGLSVDNNRLAERIRNIEGFHVDGEFNTDVYQARLQAQGLTPQQFEQDTRAQLVLSQFPTAVARSAIVTNSELRDYVRLQEQARRFQALVVKAAPKETTDETSAEGEADVELEPVPEEDIVAWYEKHPQDYMSEEQVVVGYIELDAASMGGLIEPDEDVLRANFEDQRGRFLTPESRLVSHILIEVESQAPEAERETARQQAEDLAERIRQGEDFAELAREYSDDAGSAENGGDLGWIEPGFMVQAFEDAVYELSLEEPISDPVQTGFGWHVIQLRDIRPAEGMTFTEAREILLEEYQAEADERRFLEQADRLVDIIYEDPTTLDAAAEELGLEVREAGPFGRDGAAEGVASNPEFVEAAFSDLVLGQGMVSDPIDLGMNHIVLLRLREHLPEALRPLEEVREQVVQTVRFQRAMAAAKARAEGLMSAVDAEADLAALAAAEGVELIEAEAARRNSREFDTRLLEQVFLLDRPGEAGPVVETVELDDGYAVVRLESVTDGDLAELDEATKQSYRRRIYNATANEEAYGFVRMLRAQSEIQVFEDRL